jgi:hypothetical protein
MATTKVNFLEILCGAFFCRKTFCGRHTTSLVEVLAWQANPLLDFLRAVLAPRHTTVARVRRRLSLTETLVSREMGAAACTGAFRRAHAHLRAGLGPWRPYAPAGWRGGSGEVRVLPDFSWRSSELGCQTGPKRKFQFSRRLLGDKRTLRHAPQNFPTSQNASFEESLMTSIE